MRARTAAVGGLVMAMPIGLLFVAAFFGLEPLGAVLRSILTDDGDRPTAFGRVYMLGGLLLLLPAAAVAAWPMLLRQADGRRHVRPLDLAVLVAIGLLIAVTWGALIEETIRCDVMGIPNCD